MNQDPLLSLEGLRKIYPTSGGNLHAVDGVDLTIAPGESIGLVGESGCGKSTLVRLMSRLIDPSEGSIRLDGVDIGAVPARAMGRHPLRRDIQVVFQDPTDSLNPQFRIRDSIADPLRRLGGTKSAQEVQAAVSEIARLVGLPVELLERYPHQLSGGQKARVGIARAVILRPRLLILDEPTSALDVSVQVLILRLLDSLRRQLGMSYLFVSHDLNVVRLLCDRVAVMYLGKIVECAATDEIFDHPAHPYTQALLSAIPGATIDKRIRLFGEAKSPIDPDPQSCRFAGRCPIGDALCQTRAPAFTADRTGRHWAACHFRTDSPQKNEANA